MMSFFKNKIIKDGGFTLVEIGVVLLISGFTMLMAANFVKQYTINAQYSKTIEHLRMTQDALGEYYGLNGVYPCPADPTLPAGHDDYGISVCRNFVDPAFDPDSCAAAPLTLGCTTQFSRDGDLNGSSDVVMIGAIPFRTIYEALAEKETPYREYHRLDGFGMLISYAVTEHMTNHDIHDLIDPANPNMGAIRVEDENNLSVVTPEDSAHYVIYSHGDNKRGGYSANGELSGECTVPAADPMDPPVPTPPGPSGGSIEPEIENCDNNDAIFVKGIRSMADNDDYNDDILFYTVTGHKSLWKRSLASPIGESHIYNTNVGNVGVGTDTPTHQFHVMGDLSAEVSIITRDSAVCNQNETVCLDPEAIGGSGTTCPAGQVAYAMGDNELKCRDVTWQPINIACPLVDTDADTVPDTQSFMRGFSTEGNLYCCLESGSCFDHP